jgi:alanyl-tRNA synthetase
VPTLTFLFTDIEGSTVLLRHVGESVYAQVLAGEEQRFRRLLTRGRKVLAQFDPGHPLSEADLAYLHQTHGLPPELVADLLPPAADSGRAAPTP